ncbi:MAG: PBP1A family penicillin-binding protein [Thermoanaerobaculia bacterium]|nr:PBP1A family penicillin-binding protein [Thermoanaerobaculia bacterium]
MARSRKTSKSGLLGSLTLLLRRRDHLLAKLFVGGAVVVLAVLAWSVWPYWQLSGSFETLPAEQPSRLFGSAFELAPGRALAARDLVARLDELGYQAAGDDGMTPGTYRAAGDRVSFFRRRFQAPGGESGGGVAVADFAGGRLTALSLDDRPASRVALDPPLVATFYGPELLERRPTPLAELPDDVVRAVLAAEDASFFEHPGISPTGLLRAVWTNLRAGSVRQGGSTLTQQLAKNLYLTHERRMSRKAREALLAVMLELRYSKEQILEAYLNQIFWGRSGSASLIGIGAAAWAWCGRPASELDLAEGALLAGMIPAPADYSPVRHPEVARARRDRVLDRMAELDWITAEQAAAAKQRPLPAAQAPLTRKLAPYYADAAAGEVKRRWGVADLADRGYRIYGTLDPVEQAAAETAVAAGVGELVERSERVRRKEDSFQAALVSLDPATGAVRAYVGGRDYRESQFDRLTQARRQAGSAFKPLVYATAFELGVATPATLLEDAPFTIESGGQPWTPENDDDEYRGWVTARIAIEKSLNVPTARLALQTGLEAVVATARGAGITTRLRPFPSVALGAFEVAPLELATAYATLANRGTRPAVHLVAALHDGEGREIAGGALPAPQPALSPQSAYLVTALLSGVVDYGTGASIRRLGLADPLAGKTGTTNKRRDNWFAGYAPERVALVWVGFDDDSPTPFSGSQAALPIWAKFMLATRPPGGYSRYQPPAGVRVVLIDPQTGELATDRCPEVLAEAFRDDRVPSGVCHLHGGWRAEPIDPGVRAERDEKKGSLRDWLKRVFGRDKPADRRGPSEPPTGPPP